MAELEKLSPGATEDAVQGAIVFGLLSMWDVNFMGPVDKIVQANIEDIYAHYRRDEYVFKKGLELSRGTKASFFVIPEATFDLLDARAIEFLENIDSLYLGKFITDTDTQRRILSWITERFKAGDVPLGRDSTMVLDFIQKFGDVVLLESWKIRRIVETTANTARNVGNLYYMNQAAIETYECVEVMDQITCGWCRHMNGQQFSISKTVEKYDMLFGGDVDAYIDGKPFATSFKLEEFKKLDTVGLATRGIMLAPFHPACRGRTVAVF